MHSERIKRETSSKSDILSKLPKVNKDFDKETWFYACQYKQCKAVSSQNTLGFCPDHFVKLYKEHKVEIPTAAQVIDFRHKMSMKKESESNVNKQYKMTRNLDGDCGDAGSDSNPSKEHYGATAATCEQIRGHHDNTYFVLNLRRNSDDLIESTAPSHDQSRRSSGQKGSRICIAPVCCNLGDKSYNGLCQKCFNILLSAKKEPVDRSYHNPHNADLLSSTNDSQLNHEAAENESELELNLSENWEDLQCGVEQKFGEIVIHNPRSEKRPKEDLVVVPFLTEYVQNEDSMTNTSFSFLPNQPEYRSQNQSMQCTSSKHLEESSQIVHQTLVDDIRQQRLTSHVRSHPTNLESHPQRSGQWTSVQHDSHHTLTELFNRNETFTSIQSQRPEVTQQHGISDTEHSDFQKVLQSIEDNSRRNSKKCKRQFCSNFGNSRCQGYCNSCYKTVNR